MNRLIFDIEIANPIPNKDGVMIGGINYARNWGDFEGMGIAVIGYKWNNEPARHCFNTASFLDLLIALDDEEHKLVGFNSRSFDDNLLDACGLEGVTTDYDLLEEIRIAAGFKASFRSVPRGYSYSLDAVSRANGFAKTGDSSVAPILWQQGEKQRVIDCATVDVEVTSNILDLGLAGQLIDPNTGKKLLLRRLEDASP
jgi:hypothetical protein